MVAIDLNHVDDVVARLADDSHTFPLEAKKVMRRLQGLLTENQPVPLPNILFGPLPLEPLFATARAAGSSTNISIIKKLPKPEFNVSELYTARPDGMVRALYGDRPHQFHEDGLRFRTLAELQAHTNRFLEQKKVQQKRKDQQITSQGSRQTRDLYCKLSQWITDFNALNGGVNSKRPLSSSGESAVAGAIAAGGSSGSSSSSSGVEFIIPADEFFPRCPISKERFETFWDDEEGELMYRHAVKVLLTESADADLFKLARPTLAVDDSGVRYLLVHKVLVLDKWQAEGRVVTLKDAALRYEPMGERGKLFIQRMRASAGEDEDEEDVFVLLDLTI
eukprot:scaffold446_cov183-Ochromonas_danica.AAC.14